MKIATFLLCFIASIGFAQAEAIATMPNDGNGKIVLTDEVCKYKGKTYNPLKRAYTYTLTGLTFEGCFHIEDETVVIIWGVEDNPIKRRYPVSSFSLVRKGQGV